jgi:hypothetical protein
MNRHPLIDEFWTSEKRFAALGIRIVDRCLAAEGILQLIAQAEAASADDLRSLARRHLGALTPSQTKRSRK